MIIFLFCIGILSGCSKDTIVQFAKNDVEGITVYTYDFENKEKTSNWVYRKSEMEDLLNYLKKLSGVKTESLNIKDKENLLYGIELNDGETHHILFAGDYAITDKGEYYRIDKDRAEKISKSIVGNTTVINTIYIYNHRYLSLINGKWNTEYMAKSRWTDSPIANISMRSDKAIVSKEEKYLGLEIVNNSSSNISFGSQLKLEAMEDDEWYGIDDMINENVNLGWTLELITLQSSESFKDNFNNLSYYQPLPKGKYRIIKEITMDDKKEYVAYEFEINE